MENVRGVVLTSFDYLDTKKILRVYTREQGKLTFIMHQKKGTSLPPPPLSEAEFIFGVSRGAFYTIKDFSLINSRLHLRNTFPLLKGAGELLQILLHSQLDEKPAPLLYDLLISYLDHLPLSPNPSLLIASFKLKLLNHEGVLSSSPFDPYKEEEWDILMKVTHLRSYQSLYQLTQTDSLIALADHLFTSLL
ncbi:MAG: DNA repair protein RecO [Simkaniaceae bacterium]|nr:DNA repair protein RecO [Simkaniaceae bacterium]